MQLSDFDQSKCDKFCPNTAFTQCFTYIPDESGDFNGFCSLPDRYRCWATTSKPIPLSYSSVSDFLTCHRLYYLKAIRGIQLRDEMKSPALKMGTLWDIALQKHLGGNPPQSISETIDKYQIDPMDVAKVKGIFRAYKKLEIQIDPGYKLQSKIDLKLSFDKVWGNGMPVEMPITGFYDRKYETSFAENKFSSKPEFYLDPYFLQSQVGTYFLADPSLDYCVMEIIRTPALKLGRNQDIESEDYQERVYQDAISRPSHYFIGYNNLSRRYGKKFYRNEFNLIDLESRYLHIFREIFDARASDGWYRNDRVCNNVLPGLQCDMLSCCRNNNMSETIYQIRKH